MSDQPRTCLRCQGTLKEGFLVDRGHLDAIMPGVWHEGLPQKGWWGSIKAIAIRQRRIIAYCCDDCGHIELFAAPRKSA